MLQQQVEFADVIILNKSDLVSESEMLQFEGILKKLNPDAKVLKSTYAKVPLSSILNTNSFDFKKAESHAGTL